MELLEDLQREHALIEKLLGSMKAFSELRVADSNLRGADEQLAARRAEDGRAFMRFFRKYAGDYHHAREEDELFPALVATEIPGDRGPLRVLREDHASMARILDSLEPLMIAPSLDPERAHLLSTLVQSYGTALLHHIDAENSVLIPESELRFRRASVLELPNRAPTADEQSARDDGERLLLKYPPARYPNLLRGEGCTACAAYGDRCDGVEREWWSDLEWEDFFHRND